MDVFVDKKLILELIRGAQEGKVVLPEFQRDFVWPRDGIQDLLVSVLSDYFIGSFLLLRTDSEHLPFEPRTIAGVEVPEAMMRPDFMVLDGQQRMTALHYALAAPEISLRDAKRPHLYFLDLNKVGEGVYDQSVFYERRDKSEKLLDRENQFRTFVIPFTELLRFDQWVESCDDYWYAQEEREKYEEFRTANKKWKAAIRRFEEFRVPANEIEKVSPDDLDRISEVCAIFEKLNSTGVRLSIFDLMTARLYRYGVRLRELWEEARDTSDLLNDYSENDPEGYQVLLLRTIALRRGIDVKGKSLIAMTAQGFEDDWYKAVDAFESALNRIHSTNEDGFGSFAPKWLPYSTMLPVLAATLSYIKENKIGAEGYSILRKWYWGSVFLERYAGTVETTTYRDYSDLISRFKNATFVPVAFREIEDQLLNNPKFSLYNESRINSVYKGVMNLIAIRGAKDFRFGDAIDFYTLNDHHIFPDAMLKKIKQNGGQRAYTNDQINTILNRTLISDDTNRLISDKKPSEYVRTIVPAEKKTRILDSHFVDARGMDALENDNYEKYLAAREWSILTYLRKLLQV